MNFYVPKKSILNETIGSYFPKQNSVIVLLHNEQVKVNSNNKGNLVSLTA
jgi:hypothetical protein